MLRSALNALTKLHSRQAMLKRLGTVDIYSPCRITPSNFFRFLRGPEYTTIRGVEYVIPVDSMTGQFSQIVSFSAIPDAGTFKIKIGTNTTNDIQFDATAADIQTELRLIPAFVNVIVTGSFNTGFTILFTGISVAPSLGETVDLALTESSNPVTVVFKNTSLVWADLIKKGDRIIDGNKQWAVDEIMEMYDLGAQVMAFRVRAD